MSEYAYRYVRGEISAAEYWQHISADFDFTDIGENCPQFSGFIRSTLDKGFENLDHLDRQHGFWENSNHLATLHKLHDYADYLIKETEDEVFGAWLNISLALVQGQQHLQPVYWQILKRNGQLNPKWLVFSAWNMAPLWFDLNIDTLASLIVALDLMDVCRDSFKELLEQSEPGDIHPSDWVKKVLGKINNTEH